MRIDRIKITNFKGFTVQELSFEMQPVPRRSLQGSVHLVIGENGAGKTTILDALAVALGIWHVGIGGQGSRSIAKDEIRVKAAGGNGRVNFDEQLPVMIEAHGEIGGEHFRWLREVRSATGKTLYSGASEALGAVRKIAAEARGQETPVSLPVLAYYGAGRLWREPYSARKEGGKGRAKLLRFATYKNCLDSRCRAKDLNQWLLDHDWESYQTGKEDPGYALVKKAILGCLPGAVRLRFSPGRREVVVDFKERGEQPFSNLSDGQRNMLALVGDLAVKAVKLNHLQLGAGVLRKTPGVVLIDEIDLHLHPTWQRVVIGNLRKTFPSLQFIMTTHSPLVIQSLEAHELLKLDGKIPPDWEGENSVEDILEDLQGVAQPQRSEKSFQLDKAATRYFGLLRKGKSVTPAELAKAEVAYREASTPFSDNPALTAILKLEALAAARREGAK